MDERSRWIAAMHAVAAGEKAPLICPHCGWRTLEVDPVIPPDLPKDREIRLRCTHCRKENYILLAAQKNEERKPP